MPYVPLPLKELISIPNFSFSSPWPTNVATLSTPSLLTLAVATAPVAMVQPASPVLSQALWLLALPRPSLFLQTYASSPLMHLRVILTSFPIYSGSAVSSTKMAHAARRVRAAPLPISTWVSAISRPSVMMLIFPDPQF